MELTALRILILGATFYGCNKKLAGSSFGAWVILELLMAMAKLSLLSFVT